MELNNVKNSLKKVKVISWTEEQEKAITEKGNILVSAAAGSGKTAVLVERVIRRVIEDRVNINEILAITFTNAAAKEMKKRVSEKVKSKLASSELSLSDEKFLKKQLSLLSRANITTLHSFCFKLIRENFLKLGIKPTVKIAETEEIKLLKESVLDEVTEKLYESEDSGFFVLVDKYASYRDDNALRDNIFSLIDFLDGLPFRKKWQSEVLNSFKNVSLKSEKFENTSVGKKLLSNLDYEIEYFSNIYTELYKNLSLLGKDFEAKTSMIKYEKDILSNILNAVTLEEKLTSISNMNFDRWPAKGKDIIAEEAKQTRDELKKFISNIQEKYLAITDSERVFEASESYLVVSQLFKVTDMFYDLYTEKKNEKNILDFSDLEHLALKLLYDQKNISVESNCSNDSSNSSDSFDSSDSNINYEYTESEISKELKSSFKEVQVDEYQDINSVQEAIISGLASDNLFQVGDVKQSIYGFRKARPELFMSKHDSYIDIFKLESEIENLNISKEEYLKNHDIKGKLIRLHKNFRSKKNIIDFCNYVFQTIMTKQTGMINYTKEEYLHPGPNALENDFEIPEIDFIITEDSSEKLLENVDDDLKEYFENLLFEYDKTDKEAIAVANIILEMKAEAEEQGKDFKFGDIAILLRSTKFKSEIYLRRLEEAGIKAHSEIKEGLLDNIDIEIIFSYLKIISNPMLDIDLLAVMRSYFGYFEIDDLTRIRINNIKESYYESCISYLENSDISSNGTEFSDYENEDLKKRLKNFISKLEYFREQANEKSLYDLVSEIIYDSGYYEYLMLKESDNKYIDINSKSINDLMTRVSKFQSNGINDIHKFIMYVEDLKEKEATIEISTEELEDDSSVKIMSIHKSKGLEFKTVILGDSNKKKNNQTARNSIAFDQDLGVGIDIINEKMGYKSVSTYKSVITEKLLEEELEEEMRVLYVALTRAENRLLIVAPFKTNEELEKKEDTILQNMENNKYFENSEKRVYGRYIKKLNSYLDYILLSVYLHEVNINKNFVNSKKIIIDNLSKTVDKINSSSVELYRYQEILPDKNAFDLIHEKKDKIQEYNSSLEKILPRKLSVSNITSRIKKK